MSLIRQVWLLLLGVLLFAFVGSTLTHTWMVRESLRTQLQMRNDDGAMMLALALSQQHGDEDLMRLVAAAQFDTGHYRSVRLQRSDGHVIYEGSLQPLPGVAPRWFARWLPVDAAPGVAQVADGWRPIGSLSVQSASTWPVDALWIAWLRMVGWLALLGALAAVIAAVAVRAWRRPLQAAVQQAAALEQRRYVLAEESRVPELRSLTRSMNSLVQRLRAVFDQQAQQVEELHAIAHADPVTGLATRSHFIAQLDSALRNPPPGGAGVLILRLRELAAMNQRIGHDATNRLLAALAEQLQAYPRKTAAALCGRLNGSDFGLYLPTAGLALESARSLVAALRAALATVDLGAEVVIGGVDKLQGAPGAEALALADEALARAESEGAFAIHVATPSVPALGEQQWRERIGAALAAHDTQLAERPVRERHGAQLHLACSLQLRWNPAAPFEPASRWLPMALRCKLGAQVDLAALGLALAAIAGDGRARSIELSSASLSSAGFIADVQAMLDAAAPQAARLSLELAERSLADAPRWVAQACRRWRRAGVRIGLSHAGAALQDMPRLHELGIDHVRIDAAFVRDVAAQPVVRAHARSLVTLLHGLQIQVLADDVDTEADLAALWTLGFDGAGGRAVESVARS